MFDHDTLSIIWFILTGLLLMVYLMLDGFDLGVGILHPVAKTEKDRQFMMNSIGPFWNGNEVWLVTFGGVLFGAFPTAYGSLLSGFYILFMLLLFGLIFRAVSLEFRSQVSNHTWRKFWDTVFWFSSLLVTMIIGIVIGNIMLGVPLAKNLSIDQGILEQLNIYSLLVGICFTSLIALHGSMFVYLKTKGELQKHIHTWTKRVCFIFLTLFIAVVVMTCNVAQRVTEQFALLPWVWGIAVLLIISIASMFIAVFRRHPIFSFFSSSTTIACTILLFAAIIYPTIIYSSIDPKWNLTIYNASSGTKSLNIMLIFALIGFPFIVTYTFIIYRLFWRRKPNEKNGN